MNRQTVFNLTLVVAILLFVGIGLNHFYIKSEPLGWVLTFLNVTNGLVIFLSYPRANK